MTLFVQISHKRTFEINDLYAMALTFAICFLVTKLSKNIIEKKIEKLKLKKNTKQVSIPNLKGGDLFIDVTNKKELADIIVSCVSDFGKYKVRDDKIKRLIFELVKANINNESLILSPRFIRFLALKIGSNSSNTVIARFYNMILSTDNGNRFATRVTTSAIISVISALSSTLSYGIFMMVISYTLTENCGYQCSKYFEELPSANPDEIVSVYAEKSSGQLLIAESSQPIDLFVEQPESKQVFSKESNNENIRIIKKTYKKSRKKPKMMKFSEFRKNDPVLSKFQNLEEPYVPQKKCELEQVHEIIENSIE